MYGPDFGVKLIQKYAMQWTLLSFCLSRHDNLMESISVLLLFLQQTRYNALRYCTRTLCKDYVMYKFRTNF